MFGLEKQLFNKIFDRLLPVRPADYLHTQSESLSKILPYENSFFDEGREVFILSDGALGTMWEMEPIAHEVLSMSDLEFRVQTICELFDMIVSDRITFQIMYSSKPSDAFRKPDYMEKPETFAQECMVDRVRMIESLAENPGKRPKLKRTKIYLTLRTEGKKRLGLDSKINSSESAAFEDMAAIIQETLAELREKSGIVEAHYETKVKKGLRRCEQGDLISILRDRLHSESTKRTSKHYTSSTDRIEHGRISDNILNGNIEWAPDAIASGDDLIEVLSWSSQPNKEYVGMMTELMKAKVPIDCIVNIRPNNRDEDLAGLSEELKGGGDSKRERQKKEVYETEDRIVYGEKLLSVSFHVLYRNLDLSFRDDRELRGGATFATEFTNSAIPVFVENYAAYPIFMGCLPLCYSKNISGFLRRERRPLSKTIGSYLPLFSGSLGVREFGQLMQARSGEALWTDHRASDTNPHVTILGSSGGGKSFYVSNYLTSEFAKHPDLMTFIIDSITSYEYLTKTIGEEHGRDFVKPPAKFPNLFKGEIDENRLPSIISVLSVAVGLVSKTEISATEMVLLSDSILKTYRDNQSFSKEEFIMSDDPDSLGEYHEKKGQIRLPRLSDVVDSFNTVCDIKNISPEVAISLRDKLIPFFGSGPYALIFDRTEYQEPAAKAPGITLYDLELINSDPILTTITSLIIVSDIERQVNDPINKGRMGCLVVDEAGENLKGDTPELVQFIKKAFTTFRKKNIVCKVITNDPEHYELPALRSARAIAANEIILPMDPDAITVMEGLYDGKGMFSNPYYYELVKSLVKRDGAFSELFYIGNAFKGTFAYVPTGFDYWLAVNKDEDRYNIESIRERGLNLRQTVTLLAKTFPMGVRGANGKLRHLSNDEIDSLHTQFVEHHKLKPIDRQGATANPLPSGAYQTSLDQEISL